MNRLIGGVRHITGGVWWTVEVDMAGWSRWRGVCHMRELVRTQIGDVMRSRANAIYSASEIATVTISSRTRHDCAGRWHGSRQLTQRWKQERGSAGPATWR